MTLGLNLFKQPKLKSNIPFRIGPPNVSLNIAALMQRSVIKGCLLKTLCNLPTNSSMSTCIGHGCFLTQSHIFKMLTLYATWIYFVIAKPHYNTKIIFGH